MLDEMKGGMGSDFGERKGSLSCVSNSLSLLDCSWKPAVISLSSCNVFAATQCSSVICFVFRQTQFPDQSNGDIEARKQQWLVVPELTSSHVWLAIA